MKKKIITTTIKVVVMVGVTNANHALSLISYAHVGKKARAKLFYIKLQVKNAILDPCSKITDLCNFC